MAGRQRREAHGSHEPALLQSTFRYFAMTPAYTTELGRAFIGDARDLLADLEDNSINLVVTSPPFALQRKKEYGNSDQHQYVDWLAEFAALVLAKMTADGSFVIDIGGAYEKGLPVRSLYQFRALLRFCDDIGFHLAEEFYWHNPSKLPSPIEWVNKRKIRVKDSVHTVWWLSKTPWPKADVSKVLAPYSERMKKLIRDPGEVLQAQAASVGARHQQRVRKGQWRSDPAQSSLVPEHGVEWALLVGMQGRWDQRSPGPVSGQAARVLHPVSDRARRYGSRHLRRFEHDGRSGGVRRATVARVRGTG